MLSLVPISPGIEGTDTKMMWINASKSKRTKTGYKLSKWPTDFEKGTKTVSYNAALDINPDLRPIAYDSKASYVFGK